MKRQLQVNIQAQPDDTTCGPSCLHAIYSYYGDSIKLQDVINEVKNLEEGGTLAVFLACHALKRGYAAAIYTYNLKVFDPTWFDKGRHNIIERLNAQMKAKKSPKLHSATHGYLEFLKHGGEIILQDLTTSLIRKYLNTSTPIITGLSATYLYRTPREHGRDGEWDDLKGESAGHFVVLCGYDRVDRTVLVADPLKPNPVSESHYYEINIDRVLCSILLGVLTYDANLLVIQPKNAQQR